MHTGEQLVWASYPSTHKGDSETYPRSAAVYYQDVSPVPSVPTTSPDPELAPAGLHVSARCNLKWKTVQRLHLSLPLSQRYYRRFHIALDIIPLNQHGHQRPVVPLDGRHLHPYCAYSRRYSSAPLRAESGKGTIWAYHRGQSLWIDGRLASSWICRCDSRSSSCHSTCTHGQSG